MAFSMDDIKDLMKKLADYTNTLSEDKQANFLFSNFYNTGRQVVDEFEKQLRIRKVELSSFGQHVLQFVKSKKPEEPIKFSQKEKQILLKQNYNALVLFEDDEITTEMLKEAFATRKLTTNGAICCKMRDVAHKFPFEDKQFQKDLTYWIRSNSIAEYHLMEKVEHPPRWIQELYLSIGSIRLQHMDEDLQRRFLIRWRVPSTAEGGYISNICKNFIPILQWMQDHKKVRISYLGEKDCEQMCKDRVFKSIEEARDLFPYIESSTLMMYYLE